MDYVKDSRVFGRVRALIPQPKHTNLLAALLLAVSILLATTLLLGLSSAPAVAATFSVDTTADTVDANPGNGTCADAGASCSLRAAIQEANALAGRIRSRFPPAPTP